MKTYLRILENSDDFEVVYKGQVIAVAPLVICLEIQREIELGIKK